MSLMTKFFWNASRSTFLGTTPSKKRTLQPKHPHKVCINKKFVAVGTLSNFPAPISLFLNLWSRRKNEGQAFQIPWGVLIQCGYTSGGKVALINWQQCRVRLFFRFALLCPINSGTSKQQSDFTNFLENIHSCAPFTPRFCKSWTIATAKV